MTFQLEGQRAIVKWLSVGIVVSLAVPVLLLVDSLFVMQLDLARAQPGEALRAGVIDNEVWQGFASLERTS